MVDKIINALGHIVVFLIAIGTIMCVEGERGFAVMVGTAILTTWILIKKDKIW